MTKKKLLSNILGLTVFIIVDYLIGDTYEFWPSITRGLVFLALFNVFDYMIRRHQQDNSKDD